MSQDRHGSVPGGPPLPSNIVLNCPYCGKRLVNVPSDNALAFYECATDGLLVLPPDGRLRRADAANGSEKNRDYE